MFLDFLKAYFSTFSQVLINIFKNKTKNLWGDRSSSELGCSSQYCFYILLSVGISFLPPPPLLPTPPLPSTPPFLPPWFLLNQRFSTVPAPSEGCLWSFKKCPPLPSYSDLMALGLGWALLFILLKHLFVYKMQPWLRRPICWKDHGCLGLFGWVRVSKVGASFFRD